MGDPSSKETARREEGFHVASHYPGHLGCRPSGYAGPGADACAWRGGHAERILQRVRERTGAVWIRSALEPYYGAQLLKDVRYKVGDVTPDGLAGFAIRNGNAAAVTLIDTIVFKEERYVRNLALWAHEIHHVDQYAEWGVAGFASRYAFGWEEVEAAARTRADDFVNWYKGSTGGQ
jgi:hypothetical protein